MDPKFLAALRRFDTPTICNVIELFDVRPRNEGFLDPSITALYPEQPPIVGYATTATFRSAEKATDTDGYSSLADQVERFLAEVPEPRIVVFQDLDDEPRGATYGEVMCSIYKGFGCVGLITSGAARDLEQVGRLAFPCFASSVVASHSYNRIIDVNIPVTVGDVTIAPGDVLHADANGVTTIPRDLVPQVALACQKFVDGENDVMNYVLSGQATAAGLREAMKKCGEVFAGLPAAVNRQLGER